MLCPTPRQISLTQSPFPVADLDQGVTDRQGAAPVLQPTIGGQGGNARFLVGEEGVVGLVLSGEGLGLEDVPEGGQDGLDEVVLKLGFAVAGD